MYLPKVNTDPRVKSTANFFAFSRIIGVNASACLYTQKLNACEQQ